MKKIIMVALLLTACTPVPAMQQPMGTPAIRAAAQPTATFNYMATADDAQWTARQAQQTSDAATRLLVDATITHEAIMLHLALVTQAAEQLQQQREQATQDAARYTATAYATSVPLTQTQQARANMVSGTERAMTITAPTQIVAIANAQALSETATARAWADTWVAVAVGVLIVCLGIAAVVMLYRSAPQPQPTPAPKELKPIPFTQITSGGIRKRAELRCTTAQLLELADGIKNNGKTLAFGQWKGSGVYTALNIIRHYFMRHDFAYELPGKGGELAMTEQGMMFLEDALALQGAPLPHVCVEAK